MFIDLAYLAVGIGSLVACWYFVKVISLLTAVGLFVYLLYALVRPERF